MAIEGGTDAEAFEGYVERFPGPFVGGGAGGRDGQARRASHRERVREPIEERGADLVLLPSYSPDLDPIEEAFSKIKTLVRKAGARTREALLEAIGEALMAVTPEDAMGWFKHCGYKVEDQCL